MERGVSEISVGKSPVSKQYSRIYGHPTVKEYFEDQENILHELASVTWEKIKQVINELGIRFNKLNMAGLEKDIIDDIIRERYIELNHSIMETLWKALGDRDSDDKLLKCNYQWLCELNNESLLEYVHDEFQEYVRVFIIGEESNTEEGKEFVDAILHRIFEEDTAMCIKVIEKEHLAYWNKLTDCLEDFEDKDKQEIWDCLLQNNRTDASWDNYLDYHVLFGLTEILLRYFDENVDAILRSDAGEGIDDEIVKELITADLSDISFEKLIIKCRLDEFTNKLSEFSENKLKILIQNHYFKFTPEKLLEIKGISRSLGIEFIYENASAFLACMEQCNIDLTDIKGIIELKILYKENLLKVLNFVEPTDVDKEFALLAKDLNFILPKEYVEAIWQVLDEQDKYQFLYVQMKVFSLDEIAEKFGELGGVYGQFSSRTRHKYSLHKTEYNESLCHRLVEMEFLSSCDITEEKVGTDPITFQDKYEKCITGYVKKRSEKQQ